MNDTNFPVKRILTDEQLEQHIERCGALMEGAMALHQVSGLSLYHDQAVAWRVMMEQAISERSPAQVAAMEAERGLS